jgi:hypothetical protein
MRVNEDAQLVFAGSNVRNHRTPVTSITTNQTELFRCIAVVGRHTRFRMDIVQPQVSHEHASSIEVFQPPGFVVWAEAHQDHQALMSARLRDRVDSQRCDKTDRSRSPRRSYALQRQKN